MVFNSAETNGPDTGTSPAGLPTLALLESIADGKGADTSDKLPGGDDGGKVSSGDGNGGKS